MREKINIPNDLYPKLRPRCILSGMTASVFVPDAIKLTLSVPRKLRDDPLSSAFANGYAKVKPQNSMSEYLNQNLSYASKI
jgi:hypothetical protein